MSIKSESVKKWRRTTKSRILEAMGGKCQCCGYNKCSGALELHHIDPLQKEFSLGSIRASAVSWKRIVIELRKCVLLCSNCHKEIHNECLSLSDTIESFNEEFLNYKNKKAEISICPVCGKIKPVYNITCSKSCASHYNWKKINWDEVDLKSLLEEHNYNNCKVGDILKISESSVRKRRLKLGLIQGNN